MKYKIGEWIIVFSPLYGDINKKTNKGQETRKALIFDITSSGKYKIQMLTNKDQFKTNWVYIRENGQIIEGRKHYRVSVYEDKIIRKTKEFKKLESLEIEEIRKLIQPNLY